MIAPNYWVDYKTGNDYFLTVQYYEHGRPAIHNLTDLKQIPLRRLDRLHVSCGPPAVRGRHATWHAADPPKPTGLAADCRLML